MDSLVISQRFLATALITELLLLNLNLQPVTTLKKSDVPRFMEALHSRRDGEAGRSSYLNRKRPKLPPEVFEEYQRGEIRRVTCGYHLSVSERGYGYFKLYSPRKECSLAFLGSKKQNCTVAILCEGEVVMKPSDCKKGYIMLHDGSDGFQKGCGNFSFNNIPRYARNGGSDLYFTYRGRASTKCVAFCKEDLTDEHFSNDYIAGQPRRIRRNKMSPIIHTDELCTCGLKNEQGGRIVGGEEATRFEFPWLAAIVFVFEGRFLWEGYERIPICAASLVSDRYLVTAAHCFRQGQDEDSFSVEEEDIQVLLHAHTLEFVVQDGDSGKEPKYQEIPGYDRPIETDQSEETLRFSVEKIIKHPLYNEDYDFDIAILKLATPVNIWDRKYSPICLPRIGEYIRYPTDKMHIVAGWGNFREKAAGTSRYLQKVEMPLGQCKREYEDTPRHICAGFLEGGKDSCQGDSGGPLMYKFKPVTNQYWLSGVVSYGVGCARPNILGLYTDVQELIQWIYYQTGRADSTFCKT